MYRVYKTYTGPHSAPTRIQVLQQYPHDPEAFTQGLVWSEDGDTLFESTGLYGESTVRAHTDRVTKHVRKAALDAHLFGEGLTLLPSGNLLQLTWKERTVVLWNPRTLTQVAKKPMPPTTTGEGWGITVDESRDSLFVSDGSSTLSVWSATTLDPRGTLSVTDAVTGQPVPHLNELAFHQGWIYANIWHDTRIAVISAETGVCQSYIDVGHLVPTAARGDSEAVANGLAFHPRTGHLWLTGKRWDTLYECSINMGYPRAFQIDKVFD